MIYDLFILWLPCFVLPALYLVKQNLCLVSYERRLEKAYFEVHDPHDDPESKLLLQKGKYTGVTQIWYISYWSRIYSSKACIDASYVHVIKNREWK